MKNELIKLQKNTPTSLVQTYYSCVLAPWPAFFAAVGIGSSSAGAFLTVGFATYVFLTLFMLNNLFGANIPSKKAMVCPRNNKCTPSMWLICYFPFPLVDDRRRQRRSKPSSRLPRRRWRAW